MSGITMGGIQMEQVATREAAGRKGVVNTTGTSAVTGDFYCLQCLEDTTFATLTEEGVTGDTLTGRSLGAGTTLFGSFTGYQLTSGAVRAYKA